MKPKQTIWVTWTLEGWHRYPDAPDQVAYLRCTHRHIFHYMVELQVNPAKDRELEFHMVREAISIRFRKLINIHDMGSCESQSQIISHIIDRLYPNRAHKIIVSEDQECGSTLNNGL